MTKEEHLIELLNKAWNLIEPKPKYWELNIQMPCPNINNLVKLEEENNTLGLASFISKEELFNNSSPPSTFKQIKGITTLSLIATITDELCGKRLAANINDNGTIEGWSWAT